MVTNSQESGVLEQLLNGVVQSREPAGFRMGVSTFFEEACITCFLVKVEKETQ